MNVKLLNLSTKELLEKFGAGNHKPGSGSAAAFQGMISAKLLVTVISLTNEKKRKHNYSECLPKLLKMDEDIQDRIFPELTKLFNEDSVQFDKTIKLREARDLELDLFKKNKLSREALEALELAIKIPLIIAELSIELAEIAEYVFDNAFQSARGDSQVALSGAVAALGGCLSIIQLNMLSFGGDRNEWFEDIIPKVKRLKAIYQKLNLKTISKIEILEVEVQEKASLYKEVDVLVKKIRLKQKISNPEIEEFVSQFQNLIWINRKKIWKKNILHYNDILKPGIVLKKVLGYNFDVAKEIISNVDENEDSEIAGLIDQKNKLVVVSDKFNTQIQNFTIAHEMGHAFLHKHNVMHRDRAINGSSLIASRDIEELQADKFATYFLMPSKLVKEVFENIFGTRKFKIDDNSAFYLTKGKGTSNSLRRDCKNRRGLAIMLASTNFYFDKPNDSISEIFNVSVETMAIRLEELDLFEF